MKQIISVSIDTSKEVKDFSNEQKLAFLKLYAKRFNLSKCAKSVGVTRRQVEWMCKKDRQFARSLQAIKDAHLDDIEESFITMSKEPSASGIKAGKFMLSSLRRNIYGEKIDVNVEGKIDMDDPGKSIRMMLQMLGIKKIQESASDADHTGTPSRDKTKLLSTNQNNA